MPWLGDRLTCRGWHEETVLAQRIGFVRAPGPRIVDWRVVVFDDFGVIVDHVRTEQDALNAIRH